MAGVIGNVTINCPGIDPKVMRVLNEHFEAELKERDLRIDQIAREANDWKNKYLELSKRLADAGVDDALQLRAEEFLKEGKLEEAGRVLDEALAGEEKKVDRIAENQFNRATLFDLRFEPMQALPHYEKAYTYRRSNFRYGMAYADLLSEQNDLRNRSLSTRMS